MKYAFMTFSTPTLTLDENLAVARQYGYQGIEPRTDAKHAHGVEVAASPAERAAIKAAAEKAGVSICCLATSCHFAIPASHDEQVANARQRIDLAGDVGCPAIRVFGGDFKDISRQEATDLMVKGLSAIADQAAERGVAVCFETHDSWCNADHVAEVLRRVNHPAVGCNWDVMHPVRAGGQKMEQAFFSIKPYLRHMHIHDGSKDLSKLIFLPIGLGDFDHKTALRLAASAGYQGFISGEWINWEPYQTHLPRELAALKACE